jgi:hypothetical protein
MIRTLLLTGVMCAAIVGVMLALAAVPERPVAAPAHKADRSVRVEPTPYLPDWQETALPPPVPEPLPVVVPEPVKHQPTNVCTRHKGWKVITDNGRSWRCAFARQ